MALGVLASLFAPDENAEATSKPFSILLAQRNEPRISAADVLVADPGSHVSLSIAIAADVLPKLSYIRIRGMPNDVALSAGHFIGSGSWAVPLHALPSLRAFIPTGVSGRSELIIGLVTVDGILLAERRMVLAIRPPPLGAEGSAPQSEPQSTALQPRPAIGTEPIPAAPPPRGPSTDDRALAEKLVAQGERYFQLGDVVSARLLFRRAADWGSARGALRLAATYDPGELLRLQLQGVTPDWEEALKWYERARELGAPEAEDRLAKLRR